jgi:hypothetical protein
MTLPQGCATFEPNNLNIKTIRIMTTKNTNAMLKTEEVILTPEEIATREKDFQEEFRKAIAYSTIQGILKKSGDSWCAHCKIQERNTGKKEKEWYEFWFHPLTRIPVKDSGENNIEKFSCQIGHDRVGIDDRWTFEMTFRNGVLVEGPVWTKQEDGGVDALVLKFAPIIAWGVGYLAAPLTAGLSPIIGIIVSRAIKEAAKYIVYRATQEIEDYVIGNWEDAINLVPNEFALRVTQNYIFSTRLVFDPVYYLKNNADLNEHYGSENYRGAAGHWIMYGIREGRRGSYEFDAAWYLAHNDLGIGQDDYIGAMNHWIEYGLEEGLQSSADFDIKEYLRDNSDGVAANYDEVTYETAFDYLAYCYNYYISTNSQSDGEHEVHREVHREGCRRMPAPKHRQHLGKYLSVESVMAEAKSIYPNADGCYYCLPEFHTK